MITKLLSAVLCLMFLTCPALAQAVAQPGSTISPVAATAVASNFVAKGSQGVLFGFNVVAGASAGYIMVFNATAAPADGAVTPLNCYPVSANQAVTLSYPMPEPMNTGIVLVFSTTGCFNKTASSTAYFSAQVQ